MNVSTICQMRVTPKFQAVNSFSSPLNQPQVIGATHDFSSCAAVDLNDHSVAGSNFPLPGFQRTLSMGSIAKRNTQRRIIARATHAPQSGSIQGGSSILKSKL
jgi:hypothetical protein